MYVLMNTRDERLKTIKDEILGLSGFSLADLRRKRGEWPIVGEGNHEAKLMLIGEAPGAEEVKVGRPFVGSSGQILSQLMAEVSIKREEVYITSVVKDRPPNNRKPTREEVEVYSAYTRRQIELIGPKVVATLGGLALNWMWENYSQGKWGTVSRVHGEIRKLHKVDGEMYLMPLYHPAVALYDASKKKVLLEDMRKLALFLRKFDH
jgi:uracil-DNA glycosylase